MNGLEQLQGKGCHRLENGGSDRIQARVESDEILEAPMQSPHREQWIGNIEGSNKWPASNW